MILHNAECLNSTYKSLWLTVSTLFKIQSVVKLKVCLWVSVKSKGRLHISNIKKQNGTEEIFSLQNENFGKSMRHCSPKYTFRAHDEFQRAWLASNPVVLHLWSLSWAAWTWWLRLSWWRSHVSYMSSYLGFPLQLELYLSRKFDLLWVAWPQQFKILMCASMFTLTLASCTPVTLMPYRLYQVLPMWNVWSQKIVCIRG